MFYLIAGFLGLMLIFAHYSLPKRIMNLKQLDREGVLTEAEVTLARVAERSRKSPLVTLEYRYTDNSGTDHKSIEQDVSSKFVKSLNEGDKIDIKYLSEKPKVSCVAEKESASGRSMWFGVVLLLIFDTAIGCGIYGEVYAGM